MSEKKEEPKKPRIPDKTVKTRTIFEADRIRKAAKKKTE